MFFRISDFTIGWKMQEIGQLVVVGFGGLLSLYGLLGEKEQGVVISRAT